MLSSVTMPETQTLESRADLRSDEAAWLARCRQGDERAMDSIVARHRKRIIRVAANVLRDSHEAEDVAQEAFLKAFRELHRLRDDSAFSGYLYRICVRMCMDKLRSRRADTVEFECAAEGPAENIETRVLVERLLDRLPADLRTTLVLREMEQLSYDEVAEAMGVPVGTVRSRLHTARERFRVLWCQATRGGR
ncbi:MAG: sigma-70 family RNA polymerase sigma factor [Fimbriimonadaceae bacterium]|nr:sigma-70 family RNA polymerase sigma factor [Fimbriimonadaceae bacterium]